MRIALLGCLLFLPTRGFGGDPAPGPAAEGTAASGTVAGGANGSGAPAPAPAQPEPPPAATSMPAFRGSAPSREDATFEFELPSANGDLQPAMDFTTEINPTVTSKDIPLAAPQVKGTLKSTQVDAVLRGAFPQALRCYKETKVDQKVDLVAAFVIAADGSVIQAVIASSTLPDKTFQACVKGVVTSLRFPVPEGNGIVEVKAPFTFYP